ATRDPGVAVAPHDAPAAERDLHERVVELLVRDDPAVARGEEGVVRLPESAPTPYDALVGRDEEDAVVVAVRDEEVAGEDPGAHAGEVGSRDATSPVRRPCVVWRRGRRRSWRGTPLRAAAGEEERARGEDDQAEHGQTAHAYQCCCRCADSVEALRRRAP